MKRERRRKLTRLLIQSWRERARELDQDARREQSGSPECCASSYASMAFGTAADELTQLSRGAVPEALKP